MIICADIKVRSLITQSRRTSQILFLDALISFLLPTLPLRQEDLEAFKAILLQTHLDIFPLQLDELKVPDLVC